MGARQTEESIHQDQARTVLKRRGILAAAGAVVAGIVAKQTAVPVAAATVNLGVFNTESNTTTFYLPGPTATTLPALHGTADQGMGVQGSAFNSTGVFGTVPSGASANGTMAMQAVNVSTGANGYGVYATCAKWHGVYAECGTDQGAGALVGVTNFSTGVAFQARANAPAVAAGFFVGNVSVFGSLGVSGGKFAVVKSADGKYRAMHAVEAPEAWFEDVGIGKIVNGKAEVKFDPLFAQHVHTDEYHVFLTPYAGVGALRVAARRADGFAVEEIGGTDSGTFSWRVMGKRNDISGERLPVWEMPPGADLPTPPKPPAAPSVQAAPSARPSAPASSPQGDAANPVQPAPVPRQG